MTRSPAGSRHGVGGEVGAPGESAASGESIAGAAAAACKRPGGEACMGEAGGCGAGGGGEEFPWGEVAEEEEADGVETSCVRRCLSSAVRVEMIAD